MSTETWGPGRVIADRYELLAPLGQGGMGSVWRAEHVQLRSPVAIKVLNEAIAEHPEMLERFLREAQSAAALRSTHVVQIFDYGVEDGAPYIAMELLHGESLSERLARQGTLSIAELKWVFTHISKAIEKAHEQGITHRDLKPDNLFIVKDGNEELAKVLDFGIAKVSDAQSSLSQSSGNTRTGMMLGTPHYMSPEQARGNRTVDWRSDLWAMGVIAFECLTGRVPFQSDALGDLVLQICTTEPPRPSSLTDLPVSFDAWFARAVHKSPAERFQSVQAMNEALKLAFDASEPHAVSAGRPHESAHESAQRSSASVANDARHTQSNTSQEFTTDKTQVPGTTGYAGSLGVDVITPKQSNSRLWLAGAGLALVGGALALTLTGAPEPSLPQAGTALSNTAAAEAAPKDNAPASASTANTAAAPGAAATASTTTTASASAAVTAAASAGTKTSAEGPSASQPEAKAAPPLKRRAPRRARNITRRRQAKASAPPPAAVPAPKKPKQKKKASADSLFSDRK